MKLDILDLTTERQWRSATGLTKEKFELLLTFFQKAYENLYGKTIQERTSESPNNPTMTSYSELLFFTLFSLKSGLTYDLLGFVSGIDGSNAKRNQTMGIEILKTALSEIGILPKRNFISVEEFKTYFEEHKTLILDATEQRVQRPQDDEVQKEFYSGKKKVIQ
ncbi:hypothetical protein [Emticicia sp.]|uniref:hypothetical protein n=1 Tax=Emticicia sp. TaxID=1930953 RepID=UPI0037509F7D